MSGRNKLENKAFNKIMNNCTNSFDNTFNQENVTIDSMTCIKFVLENNLYIPNTELEIFFVKDIYEILTRYQQIIDQFDLSEDVEEIHFSNTNNNRNYSKIQYLLMYLYSYKQNELNKIIDRTFSNTKDKEDAIYYIENLTNISFSKLSKWFNEKGYNFYESLVRLIDSKMDIVISNLFDIGIDNNIYNPFSSLNIQNSIEKDFDKLQKFNIIFQLKEEHLNNDFRAEIIQTELPEHVLRFYFAAILIIPVLVNNQEKVKIECWHTEEKKLLPDDADIKILGPNEVNTGSTMIHSGNVTIFRNEEMHKVLIHELFHAKRIDFSLISSKVENNIMSWLRAHCCIPNDTKILINECYVELWANILNTIINAHHLKPQEILCTIKYMLSIEKLFSCFQCAKILIFFEFKKFKDFFNEDGWDYEKIEKTIYKQNSSILSYYIIKAAILFKVTDFIKFCNSSSNSIKELLEFKKSEENMNNYFILIRDSLENEEFQKNVDFYMEYIRKNENDSFIYRTLRMTAVSFL